MKKTFGFFIIAVIVTSLLASCNSYPTTAKLENSLDSLNYAIGMSNGAQIKPYILQADTTDENILALKKGINEGFKTKTDAERLHLTGLSIGVNMGEELNKGFLMDSSLLINKEVVTKTLLEVLEGKSVAMNEEQAQAFYVKILSSIYMGQSVQLSTEQTDSLSMAFGALNGYGIKTQVIGADSAYAESVIKGIKEGMKKGGDASYKYYITAVQLATNISKELQTEGLAKDGLLEAKLDIFKAGLFAGIDGDESLMTIKAAGEYANSQLNEYMRKKNLDFLTENAKNTDVKTTPTGLQYKVLTVGTGAIPTETDSVKVHYEGRLIDGTVFDSSLARNEPALFSVNQVIPGWTEALMMMPVGSKWIVYIPQELAYGERGAGANIPPFSTLVFEVELISIEK